ncbi:hypothetical protein NEIRO03_2630, partial [Nematocida sp. AWRm78]
IPASFALSHTLSLFLPLFFFLCPVYTLYTRIICIYYRTTHNPKITRSLTANCLCTVHTHHTHSLPLSTTHTTHTPPVSTCLCCALSHLHSLVTLHILCPPAVCILPCTHSSTPLLLCTHTLFFTLFSLFPPFFFLYSVLPVQTFSITGVPV